MNKAYRLIWSRVKDAWVVAAEIVKGNGGPPPVTVGAIAVAAALTLATGSSHALPVAPTVMNGTVTFGTAGNTLTVTNSPNSIINWQAFSIAANETVRFNQLNPLSAVLNRVTGVDPSQILGALQSNGKVFLINPNGIIFGQGSRIDVGGLVASSLGISNQDFLAGSYRFVAGATAGEVKNQGTITTTAGGMVWLISPNVENSGVITAPNGSVMLAAGQSVQMVDPQRPEIAVVVSAPADRAVNMGEVLVQGGAAGMFGSLVRQEGVISADSAVAGENGRIFLKSSTATTLSVGSVTTANALGTGDGGRIVVWSDGYTQVAGSVSANGGVNGGNGGFIETSGKTLDFAGAQVSASAAKGKRGLWLIDPTDITITATEATAIVSSLDNATPTDVTVTTNSAGTDTGNILVNSTITWNSTAHLTLQADNNISLNAAISGANGTLTLDAPGTTTQTAPITAANLELLKGNFTLDNPANAIGTLAAGINLWSGPVTVGNVSVVNSQTLTVGDIGASSGINSTGSVSLTATGQSGQSGVVVNSRIDGANVTLNGTGGAGATGYNGGDGVVLNNTVNSTGGITVTGRGGAGGSGAYGGSGIATNIGASFYGTVLNAQGDITLSAYGGNGGAGGYGGYGLLLNGPGGSPWNAAINSYSSVAITARGGFANAGSGVQSMGVYDSWAGAEGGVMAPSATVNAQGGIQLTGLVDSIVLNNSGSGDISFSPGSFGSNNGLVVSGSNSAPGGGFSVSDISNYGITVAGITTNNGAVSVQASGGGYYYGGYSNVTFTGAINAGTGSVTIAAGYGGSSGAIIGIAGATSITGGSATLTATNGIGSAAAIQTAVSTLSVTNNGPGDVQISNTGALTVDKLVNTGGSVTLDNVGAVILNGDAINGTGVYAGYIPGSAPALNTYYCDITITANSPLTVNGPVWATGNIFLTAAASGTTLDSLLINSAASVSAGINAYLSAGNLVTMNSPVLVGQVIPPGSLNITQSLNPPLPPIPPLNTEDVSFFINGVVWTMMRESTDLTDEDDESYKGGRHGEDGDVPYCN